MLKEEYLCTMEIEEAVIKLLGPICVWYDDERNKEVEQNLDNYQATLKSLLLNLCSCADWINGYNSSAQLCGKKAQDIIVDSCVKCIDKDIAISLIKKLIETNGLTKEDLIEIADSVEEKK